MSSLRRIIAHPVWWMLIVVMLGLTFLGVFVVIKTGVNLGFPLTFGLIVIVIVAKVAEYLTRPAQTAQQAARHTVRKA